jgi:orotidine-5'-phosphate decarboxylase
MRRILLDQVMAGDCGPWSEPVWVDQVLYDIPNTVEAAIKTAARAGAKAVTLYEPCVRLRSGKYQQAIETAKALGLSIYVARDGDYERSLWWRAVGAE